MLPDAPSRNVVAELRGREQPDEVVVLGGHIDSWDVGQGAMDDGGGSVAAWEALRLIKQLGLAAASARSASCCGRTRRMGGRGGEAIASARGGAVEDAVRDGVRQRRVHAARHSAHGSGSLLPVVKQLIAPLARLGVTEAVMGEPEADVTPLVEAGVPALALDIDRHATSGTTTRTRT